MDYKKLAEDTLSLLHGRAKKKIFVYDFVQLELELFFKSDHKIIDQEDFKYQYICMKFLDLLYKLNRKSDLVTHKDIQLLMFDAINISDEEYKPIKTFIDEKMDRLYLIVEAGLNVSDDANEKKYLTMIARELNFDVSY